MFNYDITNSDSKSVENNTFHGIHLEGDSSFIEKTVSALSLLRNLPHFVEVKNYIGIIRQARRSGMKAYDTPPTFEVGNPTANHSPIWYASAIVHDAHHSFLYHAEKKRLNGAEPAEESWTGQAVENICLQVQLNVLKALNADSQVIEHVERLIGNPTYQDNYEARDW